MVLYRYFGVLSVCSGLLLSACATKPSVPLEDTLPPPARGVVESRLACFRGVADPECQLRIYQVMVESFKDGDPQVNYNTGYGSSQHKGDLKGIMQSLDYIKSVGVNAIWLTPIFESAPKGGQSDWTNRLDATGYFASNYFKVDPNFGTNAQFKTLVEEAHKRGLYVFLDGVFGHYKDNLVASPSGLLPQEGKCRNSDGSKRSAGTDQACADYTAPATRAFFKEVIEYWIKNYQIDGWRLDQAYQVPTDDWAFYKSVVKQTSSQTQYVNAKGAKVNPLGYMVAEVWDSEQIIQHTAYGSKLSPALSSAFDFPLRYRLVQTLATEEWGLSNGRYNLPATTLARGYETYSAYPDHAMPNLMLTNHDLVRFGDLIQRSGLAEPQDDAYWDRHKIAFAFLAAHSGPITIYYGDEIGQEVANFSSKEGGNCAVEGLCDDHVSRDDGKTTALNTREQDLKSYVAKLLALREEQPALAIGSRTHIYSDASVYVDRKDAGKNHILFVMNTKPTATTIQLKATDLGTNNKMTDVFTNSGLSPVDDVYTFNIPPLSAQFLKF